ncbi:uncharacterized protein LOC132295617 [Cornus florida]|uniref:uncharacterized protein LOC132295617 n=1 Tax=Cornus florida TaxID=4283 RepID=UPI002896BE9A|nr:uncharacterized protein LOC132295617 [Cornus florida]
MGGSSCSAYNIAEKACKDLMNQPCHIDIVMDRQTSEQISNNRLRLKVTIDTVRWLTYQACAFRGHDESLQSSNRGNFIEMVKAFASYNDDVAKIVLENAPKNANIGASCKQTDALHSAQVMEIAHLIDLNELEIGRVANQIGTLQRPRDTHWSSHFDFVCSLIRLFGPPTCSVLENIIEDESNYKSRGAADTAFNTFRSFQFVFILHLIKDIMGITNILCQALQQKSQDIVNVLQLVSSTKQIILKLRENGWNNLLDTVKSFCERHNIDVLDLSVPYTNKN